MCALRALYAFVRTSALEASPVKPAAQTSDSPCLPNANRETMKEGWPDRFHMVSLSSCTCENSNCYVNICCPDFGQTFLCFQNFQSEASNPSPWVRRSLLLPIHLQPALVMLWLGAKSMQCNTISTNSWPGYWSPTVYMLSILYTPPSHPCLSHTASTFPQLITTTPCLTENHAVMCFPCSFSVILPLLVTCKFSECSDSSIFHAFWSEFQFWPWWGPGTSWSWGQNPTAVVSPAKTLFGLPGQQNPTSTLSSLSIFIPYPGPIQQDGNDNCTKISTEREPEVLWSLVHPWRQ